MKKNSYQQILLLLMAALLSCCFCACQKVKSTEPEFPFTTLTFNNTLDDVIALEGESTDTYKSVYGGTTYTYPKAYLDHPGTIKYMFDDQNQLMSIAWTYSATDAEDLYSIYDTIHTSVTTIYGESGYNTDKATNYGDVWELESYHIIISTMLTDTNKALQYAYTKVV